MNDRDKRSARDSCNAGVQMHAMRARMDREERKLTAYVSELPESILGSTTQDEKGGGAMIYIDGTDFIGRTIESCAAFLEGEREAEARDASGWTLAEREQYNELLDADERMRWDEWLSKHCQVHDAELVNGKCAACISEEQDEVRNDH